MEWNGTGVEYSIGYESTYETGRIEYERVYHIQRVCFHECVDGGG
jgi:hypothetical protein